ncbi:MAG: hypothetical protein Q8K45_21315 [Rubrivivax sp.]|nr:hypothetical protein [Rubrivivax sp.]
MAKTGAKNLRFAQLQAEDRRLRILLLLELSAGYMARLDVLWRAMPTFGHRAGMDVLRNDVMWLAEMLLVARADDWNIEITERGLDVAQGRSVAYGVATKTAGE